MERVATAKLTRVGSRKQVQRYSCGGAYSRSEAEVFAQLATHRYENPMGTAPTRMK